MVSALIVQLRCLKRAMSCLYSITGIERDGSIIVNMLVHQDQLQKKKQTSSGPGLSVTIAHK